MANSPVHRPDGRVAPRARATRLAENEARLSFYDAADAHGAVLFVSLGRAAAGHLKTGRAIARVQHRSSIAIRDADMNGVGIRRSAVTGTVRIMFGAERLVREGLRIGAWLDCTPATWSPLPNGIAVAIPRRKPLARTVAMPAGEPESAAADGATVGGDGMSRLLHRLERLEKMVERLCHDLAAGDVEPAADELGSAVDTLRRAGYPVWPSGRNWTVGTNVLRPSALVAMARRIADRRADTSSR